MSRHSKASFNENTQYIPLSYQEIPELKKAYEILIKLRNKYEMIKQQRKINEAEKYGMANDVVAIMEAVGVLTDPLFQSRNEIESKYFSMVKDPVIAREMFLKEYEGIHKPYDYVKNFAWHLYYKVMELKESE